MTRQRSISRTFWSVPTSHILSALTISAGMSSHRMLWGGRVSLEVGFIAVSIATVIGILLGSLAGFYGGWVDSVIMRAVDIMLSIPTIFLILAVIAILEPSIVNIMIVIGLTSWMEPARLIRAEFISIKEREFVTAARAIGAGDRRIMMRHILPNGLSPILVSATMGVGAAILIESGLSFLGSAFSRPPRAGAVCCPRARTISRSPGGSPPSQALPSSSPSSATIFWAKASGTPSTPASRNNRRPLHYRSH